MPNTKVPRETRRCEREDCPNYFEVRPTSPTDSKKRFCSRSCARTVENQIRSQEKRAEWLASEESLCACKVGRIPYEDRSTNRYCSVACRKAFGKKRQADPANFVTFRCWADGETVTRPRNYGGRIYVEGQPAFCSSKCSAKWTHEILPRLQEAELLQGESF